MNAEVTSRTSRSRRGIDVTELLKLKEIVERDPASGRCRFRVQNRWEGGRRSKSLVTDLVLDGQTHPREEPVVLDADAPRVLHGEGHGASPLEYALAALLSCVTTTLIAQAALHGVEIRGVESRAEADLDFRGFLGVSNDVRKGFESVRVVFDIDAVASDRELEVLVRSAMQNSPMVDLLRNGTTVSPRMNASRPA